MSATLASLVAHAYARLQHLPRSVAASQARPSFAAALRGRSGVRVIAECKRRSPSAGTLCAADDLRGRLLAYARGGASAVSVLTEDSRFGGSFDDLALAAGTLPDTPLLMKDFVVDPAQVALGKALGASAVLLIVRCLPGDALARLVAACREHGVTPFVECHDEGELARALAFPDAVVGVNNRDLDTLAVDAAHAARLLRRVPCDRIVVAESGYDTPAAVRGLVGIADAALVGTALMRSADPAAFLAQVAAGPPRVKVCGLARASDVDIVLELGAAACGFVVAPDSPRAVAATALAGLAAIVHRAGRCPVLVSRGVRCAEVAVLAQRAKITAVQMHDASDADLAALRAGGCDPWRVLRVPVEGTALPQPATPPTLLRPAVLDGGRGGAGTRFPWSLLGPMAPACTFLAGGITPANVGELLPRRPFGIDVSSGVESTPGCKDPTRLRAVFQTIHAHAT